MPRKFDASVLTATKWNTVEDKIKFANQFVKFVESDYSPTQFPKWFYTCLSMCFGMIAHYNWGTFFDYYFDDEQGETEFREQVINYPCYGDPAYTYSDIEQQIQKWYQSH